MAQQKEWQRLRAAADASESLLVRQLLISIQYAASAKALRGVEAALAAGDALKALAIANAAMESATEVFQTPLGNEILALFNRAGVIAGETLSAEISASFDLTNPRSVEYARTRSSLFVQGLNADTKAALRATVSRSFAEGIPPREAARQLRDVIGLAPKDAAALQNYRRFLEKFSGHGSGLDLSPSVRDRLALSNIQLKTTRGLDAARVDKAAEIYRAKLLRQRAMNLVRTETMSAANHGQQELWQQAIDDGLIVEERTFRKWIVTPDDRLCPICQGMAGQLRKMGEPFRSPYNGATVGVPPIHMSCRCAVGLVFKKRAS